MNIKQVISSIPDCTIDTLHLPILLLDSALSVIGSLIAVLLVLPLIVVLIALCRV